MGKRKINFGKLVKQLRTNQEQITFLQDNNILPTSTKCEFCDKLLTTVYTKGSYHFFQCKECNKKFSLRKNTFLSNANISLRKFILLVYIFVANFWTYKDIQKETNLSSTDEDNSDNEDGASSSTHLGKATISKYFTFFRDVIGAEMLSNPKYKKIGGKGLTVEIDESMFGKRKYHRGHILGCRQMWVLGGVCRETKEVFLVVCPDNKRDKQTLLKIINDKVEKGTRILTDGWQAYKSLPQEGYTWDWVNHSENFLKPGTKDVHTNEIEGQWHCVKRTLPDSGNYDLESYLPVYLWKKQCENEGVSTFWEIMTLLKKHQDVFFSSEADNVKTSEPVALAQCFFCGGMFRGEKGVKIHQKKCEEK